MNKESLESLYKSIQEIGSEVQELANKLTFIEELDPDFTLIEIAKMHSSLLNISSKIYILRPDLVPEHLKDCEWTDYIPQ
ncbi:hypothetical protein [Acinetobacter sp. Marseille-Q1623]|uniref:hypothetical protein n=1 Tax=Acinetobacter sp. Marseille-Q1623 TaxID=2697501 RepID=UPI00157A5808|nr:hypothetical protein [Acinetobacter sp. Marseille-Q1623]